jgi:hypothetical protein
LLLFSDRAARPASASRIYLELTLRPAPRPAQVTLCDALQQARQGVSPATRQFSRRRAVVGGASLRTGRRRSVAGAFQGSAWPRGTGRAQAVASKNAPAGNACAEFAAQLAQLCFNCGVRFDRSMRAEIAVGTISPDRRRK